MYEASLLVRNGQYLHSIQTHVVKADTGKLWYKFVENT